MNCKPGDLCWIVAGAFPENFGRIVRVVRPAKRKDRDWYVESIGGPLTGQTGLTPFGVTMDRALTPIRPEPEAQPAPPQTVETV